MTKAADPTLEDLLLAAATGDRAAFRQLYDRSSPRLWPVVLRIVARRDRAEEILQDAYVAIWRRAGDYRLERGSALAWMTAIARYRALDLVRQDRREISLDEVEGSDTWHDPKADPLRDAMNSAAARAIANCLNGLDERTRQLIVLAYNYGYTHQELGARFDAPLGTVKSLIRRGLLKLRACLDP